MGPIPPELEMPDGPLVTATGCRITSTTRGCGCSTSAAATRARRCRTPSVRSTRPGTFPGAVFVDWEHDFVDPTTRCRCRSPARRRSPRAPASSASATGIWSSPTTTTTGSSPRGWRGRFATTAPSRACSTAAGPPGWTRAARSATRARRPSRRTFTARPRPRLRRTLAEVEDAQGRGATLVDARPRHLFLGEQGVANTGHIPGSRCLPYQELVDGATGLWAAPDGGQAARARRRDRPRPTARAS